MGNAFTHIELRTSAVDRAKGFYADVFDWKLSDVPMDGFSYTMVDVGDGVGGGMMPVDSSAGSQWLPFVHVEELEGTVDRALELGASIVQAITPIPGDSAFAVIADPVGALVGLLQAGT